jgi:hypothetical protein
MASADLEDLVNDPEDVLAEYNPFFYLQVNGPYRFPAPNKISLEKGPGLAGNSGEIFIIIKAGWECDFKIRAKGPSGIGQFNVFGREAVQDEYPRQAFNIQTALERNGVSDSGRSLYFTARGGSMIVVSSEGIRPLGEQWSANDGFNDYFVQEANLRGIDDVSRFNDGILLSLTAPFGKYDDPETYSLRFNDPNGEVDFTMLQARNVLAEDPEMSVVPTMNPGDGGISLDPDRGGPEVIPTATFGPPEVIDTDTDVEGEEWVVDIRERLTPDDFGEGVGTWSIFVDGTMKESGLTQDDARRIAEQYAEQRRERAKIPDDDKKDRQNDGIPWLGILAGAFIVVALIVGVSSFAKGAGAAAVGGGATDGEE